MKKILIIEDDIEINKLLGKILDREGYEIVHAFSGTEAKLVLEKENPSLILLDLMLPGITGEEVLQYIREDKQNNVPIIIISAKTSLSDKVTLLKDGADDYITKPFEIEEVLARVHASLRRSGQEHETSEVMRYKELKLFPHARNAMVNDSEISLTIHEFDILLLLMKNPEKAFSREHLYELIWNGGYYGENNTVNVHVSNIRKKIKEKSSEIEYIKTVYGFGFKLG